MHPLFNRIAKNKSGFYMGLGALLLVAGWRICVVASAPSHWREIAVEFGAIPQYRHELMGNHGIRAPFIRRILKMAGATF